MASEIRTFTGKLVDLENPTVEMIDIRDIAHALSQINRFTGHTRRRYSVAEHCLIGSHHVAPALALEFLLHDASEAYLGDVSSPLKRLIGTPYLYLEERWTRVIEQAFRLRAGEAKNPEIKRMDALMLDCEMNVLMRKYDVWEPAGEEAKRICRRLVVETARVESEFLCAFDFYVRQRYFESAAPQVADAPELSGSAGAS